MAISAVYSANFDRLESAVTKAVVTLKTFETGAKNAARDVSRLAESFSGAKIQAEAVKVARAVESIGGASRLTDTEARRVNATVTEAIDKYQRLGQIAPEALQRLARETTRVEESTGSLSSSVGKVAAPLALAGGAAVKFATDLNAGMANVATLVPGNIERIEQFKGSIQDLAVETGKSTADLSGGLYEVISSIGDTGDTLKILEINAKAGAAGLASTAEAIKFTSAVTNAYGDTSAEAFQKVADLGFKTVELGQTTFPDLAASIGGIAPLAKETGISLEEMFAVLATATGVTGKGASEVVTQMGAAITALVSPSKEMAELYDRIGVTSGEALIKQKGLVGALQEVARGAEAADMPLIDLLGRKEAWIITSALAGSQAEKFSQKLGEMGAAVGATGRAFEQQTQGINKAGFQYEQFRQVVVTSMQKAGDAVLSSLPGPLGVAAVGFSDMGGRALSAGGEIAQMVIATKVLAGAEGLGALLGPLRTTARLTRDVETASIAAAGAQGVLAGATTGLMGRLAVFAGTVGIPIAAIGAFIVGLKGMGDVSDEVKHPMARFGYSLTNLVGLTDKAKQSTDLAAKATTQLGAVTGQHVKLLASHGTATEHTASAVSGYAQELAAVNRVVDALTRTQRANIDAGISLGRSTEEIVDRINKMGVGVKVSAATIEVYKDRLEEAKRRTEELNKATKESEEFHKRMGASVWDTTQRLREIEKKRLDDAMQGMQRSAAAIVRDLNTKTQAEQHAAETIRSLTMGTLEFQLDAIQRKGEAEKAALESAGKLAADTAQAIDQSTRVQTVVTIAMHDKVKQSVITLINLIPGLRDAIELAFPGYLEQLEQANKKTDDAATKTTTWRERLSDLATSFANLAQVSGGALSEVARAIGSILNTMEAGARAGETFMKGLKEALGPGNKNWGSIAGNIAAGLAGGIGAMAEATDPMKDTLERTLGGAMTGAAIGGAVATAAAAAKLATTTGQIYIVAAAAVVGAFIGYFRGQAARREMRIVGQEWGQDISEGLSEEIRKATSFGGDRVANALFRMKDIISEAGGVDTSNFDRLITRLRDVFVMVETGTFSIAQAQRVLNENFADFAQASIETGRLASHELQEIIRLNAEMGVNASSVIDFVSQQATRAGAGLAAIAGPITDGIIKWRDEVATTHAKLAELTEAGKVGTEEWITAQTRLNELGVEHGEIVAKSAEDLEALGVVALGTFGAALESGVGYLDAVRAISPGIDAVIDAQKALGITSDNLVVQDLANFRDRVRANERLVAAAEALDDTLLAVSHTTGLNAQSLASMERLGLSTFQRLRDAGFSEVEALRMMGDFLENVTRAHMDLGIPIDENIGALITLADQHGVLQTKSKDFKDVFADGVRSLVDVINDLIKTLGGVPSAVQGIGKAIDNLPRRVPIDFEFNVPDLPAVAGVNIQGAAHGILTHGPTLAWFGEGGETELGGPVSFMSKALAGALEQVGSSSEALGGRGGRQVVINIDARGALIGDYESQQRLSRLVSDALMNSYELRGQVGLVGVR